MASPAAGAAPPPSGLAPQLLASADDRAAQIRHRIQLLIVLAGMLMLYLSMPWWTGGAFAIRQHHLDQYNRLVDGMLEGHLYVKEPIPAGLLAMADPYNPATNGEWRYGHGLFDQSFYEGKCYLYWGLTPVLVLYLPFRLLTGGLRVPNPLATVFFSYGALLFATAFLLQMRRRYFPESPPWMTTAGVLLVGTANITCYLIGQSNVYQVALCAGVCFSVATFYYLSRAFERTPQRGRYLSFAAISLALAIGSRPHFVLTGVVISLITLGELARRRDFTRARLIAFMGPLAAGGLVLGLYNFLRFGNFLEFGARYQLAIIDMRTLSMFAANRIPSTLYFMFLQPPTFTKAYPYINPMPKLPTWLKQPSAFLLERITGLFASTPFLWLMVFAAAYSLLRPAPVPKPLPKLELALCASVVLILVALLSSTPATMRYLADFASFLDFAGVIAWLHLDGRFASRPVARKAWRGTGLVLIVCSAIIGPALGLPYPKHYMDG